MQGRSCLDIFTSLQAKGKFLELFYKKKGGRRKKRTREGGKEIEVGRAAVGTGLQTSKILQSMIHTQRHKVKATPLGAVLQTDLRDALPLSSRFSIDIVTKASASEAPPMSSAPKGC